VVAEQLVTLQQRHRDRPINTSVANVAVLDVTTAATDILTFCSNNDWLTASDDDDFSV